MTTLPVRATDKRTFTCRRCGACCRNLKEQFMLGALDAYRLGNFLKKHMDDIQTIEDVFSKYAHIGTIMEGYPVYLMNTCGKDDACVFLENGCCSVYESRPGVCRLYPLTVDISADGKRPLFYQCLDRHKAHFNGGEWNIGEWIKHNFPDEAQAYLLEESEVLLKIGHLIRQIGIQRTQEYLFPLLYFRYFNYDLDQPFMPQYRQNQQSLLKDLRMKL